MVQWHNGYLVSGTPLFGVRKTISVYVEVSVLEFKYIYISGGRRSFLMSLASSALTAILNA